MNALSTINQRPGQNSARPWDAIISFDIAPYFHFSRSGELGHGKTGPGSSSAAFRAFSGLSSLYPALQEATTLPAILLQSFTTTGLV